MWDQAKWYFLKVFAPKYLPVMVLTGIGYVVTFMLSHAHVFETYGVTTGQWPLTMQPPSGTVTLIEWDTLGKSLGGLVVVLVSGIIAAVQHHATGTPTVAGGMRSTDPPAKGV